MNMAYSIVDIEGFVIAIRDGAAKSIAETYTENLDNFISVDQIKNFIIDNAIGIDNNNLPMITEDIFDDIFIYVRNTIYQVALAKLAAQGYIECAWDTNMHEMIFWIDSKSQEQIPVNSLPS